MAEEARLESVYTPKAYPEFESRSLRKKENFGSLFLCRDENSESSLWGMVKNLCLGINVAEAEDEEFGVVDAVEFGPERLDF